MIPHADLHTRHHASLHAKYTRLYNEVRIHQGSRAPGRNIALHGVLEGHRTRRATSVELARSIRTFRRWLAPPPSPTSVHDRTPLGQTASVPSQAGGLYAIPRSIVMCESGGSYTAHNPSGAGGAYQMEPGTFHAYGGVGDPAKAPPAEQDRVASRLYAAEGTRPWVSSRKCWG